MSNSNSKFASDATNVYRVLKRVGFKGSKNQVVDQLNAYANLRDKKDLFFKEVFSTLGYVLQAVKLSDIGPLYQATTSSYRTLTMMLLILKSTLKIF